MPTASRRWGGAGKRIPKDRAAGRLGPVRNDAAPAGKERKYARRERERRFLFEAQPAGHVERTVRIADRYLANTRMRLRQAAELAPDGTERSIIYKLTQKLPGPGGGPGLITTMYLTSDEYDLVSLLPAASLHKTRLSIPPLGVDLFEGALTGLVLGEVEFSDDETMAAFVPPVGARAEVTYDERFTGGRLVTTTAPVLAALLAEPTARRLVDPLGTP